MLPFLKKRIAQDGLPLPPLKLYYLVTGTKDEQWFIDGGIAGKDCVRQALERNDISLTPDSRMLDFGCGCGRVMRHWKNAHWELYGTDYNKDLIRWNRKNLSFANFEINQLSPPLNYESGFFDLVYAFSVFTHLSLDLQKAWRDEMRRVMKPGGVILFTTHGKHMRDSELSAEEKALYDRDELIVRSGGRSGENACATFHSENCVEKIFGTGFEKIEFVQDGALGNPGQDLNIYRAV